MLTIVFKERISKVTPIRIVAGNIGIGIGPSLGGLLYSWLGYIGPFIIIGSMVLLSWICFKFCLSSESIESIIVEGEQPQETTNSVVTYGTLCRVRVRVI